MDYKVKSDEGRAWGKWLLRKAFEDYLPAEIVWREKTTIDSGTGAIKTYDLEAITQGSIRGSFAPSHKQPHHRLELDIASTGHYY